MERSKIVLALAEIASQGRYTVDPAGSRKMNAVFDAVAKLINELEAEEAAAAAEESVDESS